jgi:hypothetical protein
VKDRAIWKAPRRRRSWYRRRLRKQRIVAAAMLVMFIAGVCALNFIRILSHTGGSRGVSDSFAVLNFLDRDLGFTAPHANKHLRYVTRIPDVYPYSVVPGGVRNAEALREAAGSDRAVAKHFEHFDFDHARLERITEPREVYVSYRIRDTVFWTRKKVHLPAGELLLTDGKIAARAKCGNQISDAAKPEVSDEEPDKDVMDQPVAIEPIGPPLPIRSSVALPDLAVGQPIAAGWTGGFSFPIVPITGGPPVKVCVTKGGKLMPCGPKGPPTPEPGTMVLLGSGLALIVWRYRMKDAASRLSA